MADETPQIREERARQLAVQSALRDERVDNRLTGLERDMAALRDSVREAAKNYAELQRSVSKLHDAIDGLAETQRTRDAVAEALRASVDRANEHQISTRAFAIGVATIVVTLIGLILSQAHFFTG